MEGEKLESIAKKIKDIQHSPQQATEQQIKSLYPKIPRPDLVKFTLPDGVNWWDIKDIYNEIQEVKKNIIKVRDEMDRKKFNELNFMVNQLLEFLDDKLSVENIISVGEPLLIEKFRKKDE